ncbi:hypothetical protein U0C82_00150 [Fulvimarina sp. 2208YS6-2-32]|uniref:Uncharacterized protein n=1 Tax=Fulvimarina uroteuthidis TaxID=3098149 RepID=A0ABU5HWT9_9HYPH|nr:hypothetical protein [Fulvimarina sp. 2208YS6-2-32]MDY8107557.1 hypothetical protein [Fulvimarina sp. 2208YS6-2-32]
MASTFTGFSRIAALALVTAGLAAPSAHAQGAADMQAPDGEVVYETNGQFPTTARDEFSGLPGVDLSDGAGKVRVQGPGGLQNNVGAIGMAAPSTSSANPLPLQNDTATTGGSIAVRR